MALSASEFSGAPDTSGLSNVVQNTDAPTAGDKGLLVDYSQSGVFHTEPLYIVGNEKMYGYENYKQYDQYTGHGLNQQPSFASNGYVVEENGKKMTSGKTYYLGFQTLMVPVTTSS